MSRLWLLAVSIALVTCLFCQPAHAGKLEDTFTAAQNSYAAKRYDEAVDGFVAVADMLVKAKQTPKARMVLGNAAVIRITQERYDDAINLYRQALALPGKDDAFAAKAWRNLAVCHTQLKQYTLTISCLEQLLPKTQKISPTEKETVSNLYAQLGDAYRALEIYTKAVECYEKANSLLPAETKPEVRGKILTALGLCQGNLGRFAQAHDNLETARQIASRLDQPLTLAESISNLGILAWESGDYAKASDLLNQALAVEKSASLSRHEGIDNNNLGLVFKSVGQHEDAAAHFKTAIDIARTAENAKDEGIALSNLALVRRIQGDMTAARENYAAAFALYKKENFREGQASTLLGLGKIREIADRDFAGALAAYQEAHDIYAALSMPRGQAEALNQMGRVLRKAATPQRTTRDLVFDNEEITFPVIDHMTATDKARIAYQKALELAEPLGIRELIWSSRQGLGFLLWQEGKLKEALAEYQAAITLVTSMRGKQANVELLGDYMKDKSDLFTEAMEVCIALHKATQEEHYMVLAMEYDETLRNEISKAGMSLVQMNYADPAKQDIYRKLVDVNAQRDKLALAVPAVEQVGINVEKSKIEQQKNVELRIEEAQKTRAEVTSLEKSYNELLAEWRKKYPEDAVMFDSSAKVDTAAIQAGLAADDAVLYYIPLPDNLIITVITKEGTSLYSVDVPQKELNHMVRDEFLYEGIEKGARSMDSAEEDQKQMIACVQLMRRFYALLIEPVASTIQDKQNLTIISSGYLAQLPFLALVVDDSDPLHPLFLVEQKNISFSRLSFYQANRQSTSYAPPASILAVGDPRNHKFDPFKPLPGAEAEVRNVIATLELPPDKVVENYQDKATETWLKENFNKNQYDVMYFATHGMPYSDTYTKYYVEYNKLSDKTKERYRQTKDYVDVNLPGLTPLNGYLLMAATDTDDGFLTIKEILELPSEAFHSTQSVILSACNTGVTFAPKSFASDEIEQTLSAPAVENELRKAGWTPGVDQISFVDTFMKRGVGYTYGTLWFADDRASSVILSQFTQHMKQENLPSAYTQSLRTYIADCKAGNSPLNSEDSIYTTVPLHPYFWAVGSIFTH